jgi:hypothetical protein
VQHPARRVAACLVVVVTVSLAGALSSTALTLRLTPPSLTITPNIGLTNGQQITINGAGFAPSETSLVALECLRAATSTTDCSASSVPLSVNGAGQFSSTFTVTTGAVGTGTCGTSITDAACEIAIASSGTNSIVAFASLAFASGPGVTVTPSTNLRNGETVTITGADFTPGDIVYALECLTMNISEAACQTGTATAIKVSSSGALASTAFQVVAGNVGNGVCGTTVINYNHCLIEVANIRQSDAGVATIDFALSLAPMATHVTGYAVAGRTVNVAVLGKNFTADPTVVGPPGTVATLVSDTPTRLVLRVRETAKVRRGMYRFTITFPGGGTTSIAYNVR